MNHVATAVVVLWLTGIIGSAIAAVWTQDGRWVGTFVVLLVLLAVPMLLTGKDDNDG